MEKKKVNKKIKKKKKGFTLIELLAVIIILGVIMLIAIPSVTRYINDSRKNSYVDTAKQIVKGAIPMVNGGELDMYDTNTTYYIPASCVPTENAMSSPYGEFDKAYVIVGYTGEGYEYYWVSVDTAHQGIEMRAYNKLSKSDVKPNIETIEPNVGIGDRENIRILDAEECQGFSEPSVRAKSINENGEVVDSSPQLTVISGDGNHVGDEVALGNEHFYVVNPNKNNKKVLIAKYNLNVGSNKNPNVPEGIQNETVKGSVSGSTMYGNVAYASTNYWKEKIGNTYPGQICTSTTTTNCAYVFDNNSSIYQYLSDYKETLGISGSIRLLGVDEALELGCVFTPYQSCSNALPFTYSTSYWLGSPGSIYNMWYIRTDKTIFCDYSPTNSYGQGVRPVIEI